MMCFAALPPPPPTHDSHKDYAPIWSELPWHQRHPMLFALCWGAVYFLAVYFLAVYIIGRLS